MRRVQLGAGDRGVVQTATFSGPAATAGEARDLLTKAGYFVMSAPAGIGYEPEEDEVFLSIDVGDPNAGSVIEHLGWRHRATTARADLIGGRG